MRAVFAVVTTCLAIGLVACGDDAAAPPPVVAKGVPTSVCSPVTYGGEGQPHFLVAVVGPLQNAFADHGIQNSQAVKLVMQQRGWRAGEHRVGIQVCDEASAKQFVDPAKCERNARAFAGNASVIAVVGPVLSSCAAVMIPILNRSEHGPVGEVGLGNTYLGLTREGPGVERGHPDRLYPAGTRSYVRTVPADDAQAAAAVVAARDAGARRPFALHDGDTYGEGLATSFQQAAGVAGLEPAGIAAWDGAANGYGALAERVRRSGADAVYLAGYVTSNGPRLLRDLRAALGPRVPVLAPDGFNQPTALVEGAGKGAEGVFITLTAAPTKELPSAGRRWADEFERRWGAKPCCYAVHAGEATRIVMDAIAGSDGSREQVLQKLQQTRAGAGGLVGDYRFDMFGDTTLRAIAVYRIRGAKARFERMIEPPQPLLARR